MGNFFSGKIVFLCIMSDKIKKNIEIVNRKAEHEYFFLSRFEAGIMLGGTEVKAIRQGKANLTDAFCQFSHGELFVRNLHISEYKYGTYNNHETRRIRKLLLKRSELRKLERKVNEKGMTIVPFRLFINERGFVKVEIALAQGKKSYDKRETLKQKDNQRTMEQLKKIRL